MTQDVVEVDPDAWMDGPDEYGDTYRHAKLQFENFKANFQTRKDEDGQVWYLVDESEEGTRMMHKDEMWGWFIYCCGPAEPDSCFE